MGSDRVRGEGRPRRGLREGPAASENTEPLPRVQSCRGGPRRSPKAFRPTTQGAGVPGQEGERVEDKGNAWLTGRGLRLLGAARGASPRPCSVPNPARPCDCDRHDPWSGLDTPCLPGREPDPRAAGRAGSPRGQRAAEQRPGPGTHHAAPWSARQPRARCKCAGGNSSGPPWSSCGEEEGHLSLAGKQPSPRAESHGLGAQPRRPQQGRAGTRDRLARPRGPVAGPHPHFPVDPSAWR